MIEFGRLGRGSGGRGLRIGRERKGEAFLGGESQFVPKARRRKPFVLLRRLNRLAQVDGYNALSFLAKNTRKSKQPVQAEDISKKQRTSLFDNKVMSMMNTMSSAKEILEEIKRKAALEAIRRQMQIWRQSIRADRRLSREARQNALTKVDRYENRLLAREALKWHGPSIMRRIHLAVMSMQA